MHYAVFKLVSMGYMEGIKGVLIYIESEVKMNAFSVLAAINLSLAALKCCVQCAKIN